jgi:hypothetical protein
MRQLCRHVDGDRRHPYFQRMMVGLIHRDRHLMALRLLDGMANLLDALLRRHQLAHQLMDVLQSLDELNLDELPPFLGEFRLEQDAHLDATAVVLEDAASVDEELRQLKMDYCLHVVDVAGSRRHLHPVVLRWQV